MPNLALKQSPKVHFRGGKIKVLLRERIISSPASLVYESSLPDVESDGDDGGLLPALWLLDGDAWAD